MIIRSNKASEEEVDGEGTVEDYPMPEEDIGISTQKLEGRIPEKGFYRNKVCHEICYVLEGQGKVYINNETSNVKEGDIFIIEEGQKSCIKTDKLELLVITRPDWYEEQCEIVE